MDNSLNEFHPYGEYI